MALASPLQSQRSFAQSWSGLVGAGTTGCGRSTIEKIRNAFCGVVKDLYFGEIETASKRKASALALGLAASASSAHALGVAPCNVVLHVHDEALLRLRSSLDPHGPASRGRSSKVVQHAVWVDVGSSEPLRFVPTELCALASKRADVIATCIYNVLESVAQCLDKGSVAGGACAGQDGPKPWLAHVLVGDGVGTSEAAAKLVLPWAVRDLTSFEYFIMVVKCASHQVNLSIGAAVTGAPATIAAGNGLAATDPNALAARREARGSQPQQSVCGVVVRLFKYMINMYYDEFYSALRGLVARLAFAEHRSAAAQASADKWEKMAELYGVGVVPGRLLSCLNNGLGSWTHTLSAPALDGSAQAGVRGVLLEVLRSRLLLVDERPTLTRFFTFRVHIQALLLLSMLGIASETFRLSTVKPLEKTSQRLRSVLAFLSLPSTPQYLRRTSLVLDLLDHAHRTCAQLHKPGEPVLVRLAKGEVMSTWDEDLSRLLRRLRWDPELDVAALVTLVFLVSIDVFVRFGQYEAYPYKLFELCRSHNEHWRVNCMQFLGVSDEDLDTGFSLRLKQLALGSGETESQQLQFLLSDRVQDALERTFGAAMVSSLPVERKHAETKRYEGPRLCSVATASRNQLLRHFHRDRVEMLGRLEATETSLRQAMKTNVQSMAWQRRPALVSLGARARDDQSASALDQQTEAVRSAVEENRADWQEEVQAARRLAQESVKRAKVSIPVRESEWAEWIAEHRSEFSAWMQTSSEDRRAHNKRLTASRSIPAPAPRLPPVSAAGVGKTGDRWVELLWGRSGWFALQMGGRVVTILVSFLRGCMWGISIDQLSAARGGAFYLDDTGIRLRRLVRPLREFATAVVDDVYELCLSGGVVGGKVVLRVAHAAKVEAPLPKPPRKRSAESSAPALDALASSGDEKLAVDELKDIDSDSSGCSVDTDVDAEVGEDVQKDAEELKTKLAERIHELAAHALGPALAPAPASPAAMPRGPRASSGTWNVWEGVWFYMTQTPGYTDLKMNLRGSFHKDYDGGMGKRSPGKALTPAHYGDSLEDPWRTQILLRAWALRRARERGWVREREGREREAQQQAAAICHDIRRRHDGPPKKPFLGSHPAHVLFQKWIPREVADLLAESAAAVGAEALVGARA